MHIFNVSYDQFENSSWRLMFLVFGMRQIFVLSVWTQFSETYVGQMSFEELSWNWYWLCRLPPLSLLSYDQNTNVFLRKSLCHFLLDSEMKGVDFIWTVQSFSICHENWNCNGVWEWKCATEKDGKEISWWN